MQRIVAFSIVGACGLVLAGCLGDDPKEFPPSLDVSLTLPAAAVIDSEEDALLLAPGSIVEQSILAHLRDEANEEYEQNHDFTGLDRQDGDRQCLGGGTQRVLSRSLEMVGSPYNGSSFDVIRYANQECNETHTIDGSLNGMRSMGFPTQGTGAGEFTTNVDYIVYDQSGAGLRDPFTIASYRDSNMSMGRHGLVHAHLMRKNEFNYYGAAGGKLRGYSVVKLVSEGSSSYVRTVQLGTSETDFTLDYGPDGVREVTEGHVENYQGYFARRYSRRGGVNIPAGCPQGGIEAATTSTLYVDVVPPSLRTGSLFNASREVVTGSLQLVDRDGNVANVSYDAAAKAVTVDLNGGIPVVFSYQEANALMQQRCKM